MKKKGIYKIPMEQLIDKTGSLYKLVLLANNGSIMAKRTKEVLLGVTGSIAAYKACDIVNRLKRAGCNVTVALTEEARHFITPLTLQNLSGNKVVTGMFDLPENYDPLHTSLAQRADLVLVAPATANLIGKLASGICDDILTCAIMATDAPVLIAPAMNDKMYEHKAMVENVAKLKKWGYKFIGPKRGNLACGYKGIGHIADTEDIVRQAKGMLR
jgi:phosphopantothenoylcysteine decarboxylase/phosphopantothenate--cysteine ligase